MTSARPDTAMSDYRSALVIGLFLTTVYLFLLMAATDAGYNTWFALVLAPVMFLLASVPLRRMLEKVEPDLWIRRAVVLGLAAKLIGAFARYYVNELVLGQADAASYYLAGTNLAREFRHFEIGGPAFQEQLPNLAGTQFIRLLSGIIYVFLGPSLLAGYLVFAFMSFWGAYLFYRAFALAVPDGLRRRYVALVFFLPSVVFWPSSLGKEAWMTTMLGLGAYGLARLLTQRRGAYPLFLLALAGMAVVRPHVAAIFGAGASAAFVLRRSKGSGGTARKVIGLVVLALAAGLVLNQLQSFFDLQDGLNPQQVLDETTRRSSQGGSQFEAVHATSPAQLPLAVITVLFRPFLFEAKGITGIVTAMEGTVLLGLFIWNVPRLSRLPAKMIVQPYVGFALIYLLIFAFAFSAISNFGILARQRTQLFPIASILLAVPYESSIRSRSSPRSQRLGPSASAPRAYPSLGASPSARSGASPPARPGAGLSACPETSHRARLDRRGREPGEQQDRSGSRPPPTGPERPLQVGVVQARFIGRSAAARRRLPSAAPAEVPAGHRPSDRFGLRS